MATQLPIRAPGMTSLGAPTHARYGVVVFAVTLAILSYIDRVCISQAAPYITRDLGLTSTQMGQVFAAFGLGYALFEIPGGYLGDRLGPRKVLMRIVICWSVFTALTGLRWDLIWRPILNLPFVAGHISLAVATVSFASLWTIRLLFGAGEAGCFPNLTKAFSIWLKDDEKTRAQSIMWMFARWGGAFTPPLVVAVMSFTSWRGAFGLFGLLGVVWAILFYRWFRDDPAEHPSVNAAERQLLEESRHNVQSHGPPPWGKMLQSRSVWLLWLQYFCMSYPWYFYITWLPTYLRKHWGLSDGETAIYAILPLFFGGLGSIVCGLLTPRVIRLTGSVTKARRVLACSGFSLAALLLIAVIHAPNVRLAMGFMAVASFCNDIIMPGAWASVMDVGGKYAGTVAGSMNMMGNLAGYVAPSVGGILLERGDIGWDMLMYSMAGVYIVGLMCWPFIDPVAPIEGPAAA